jgi:hypothetical protein
MDYDFDSASRQFNGASVFEIRVKYSSCGSGYPTHPSFGAKKAKQINLFAKIQKSPCSFIASFHIFCF